MPKKIKILLLLSLSILIFYVIVFLSLYDSLPDMIDARRDLDGTVKVAHKSTLFWAVFTNFIINMMFYIVTPMPHLCNFPCEITDENRESAYLKMQYCLAGCAIFISILFSFIVFESIDLSEYKNTFYTVLALYAGILILPLFFVFKK